MLDDNPIFTVTDLKQFTYCPRVVFFEQCLPHIRPRTFKMDAGHQAHEEEQERAVRRKLSQYDEETGTRQFRVELTSHHLGLTGKLDEVVYPEDGRIIPVDYKLAKRVSANHRLQLAAYSLLLEDIEDCIVTHGFVYLIPQRQTTKIKITDKLRQAVLTTLDALQKMVTFEIMPPPLDKPTQCSNCEFRRFCNDV